MLRCKSTKIRTQDLRAENSRKADERNQQRNGKTYYVHEDDST